MSAHACGMCMSQCGHWRIPLFLFAVPRKTKKMQANPSASVLISLCLPFPLAGWQGK